MIRPVDTCYMCDAPATSVEHVPPKCLFPKPKDLPTGADLRRQLITVPACTAHNNDKAADDEYLLFVLVINLPANTIAQNHFAKAIMRAIERRPNLATAMMRSPTPVIAVDTATGQSQATVAVDIDRDRFDRALDHLGRALYFHDVGKRWLGDIQVHPEFMLATLDPAKAAQINAPLEHMTKLLNFAFANAPRVGANPEVFQYQVIQGNGLAPVLMRLHFYEDVKVALFFRT